MLPSTLASLGVALLLSLPAAGQAPAGTCRACGGDGRVACGEHRAPELALERDGVLCTLHSGCAACGGALRVDCPGCEAVPADPGDGERARRLAFTERFARFGEIVGRAVLGAGNRHFNLVCELEPMRVDGKRRGRHELLHLYLDRLEAVHAAYLAAFGLTEGALTARSEVFLWARREDHERLGQELCGYTTEFPMYKRGLEAISSVWLDPRQMVDDSALHHNVVHHVVHGMMNVQPPTGYAGKLRMGWADEGLSLWFEDRLFGEIRGYCFWRDEVPIGLAPGKWRPALRKRLAAAEALDLPALLELDSIDLTREQEALGFSLIDYLAARDLALLGKLLERLRARTPARDAFVEVYGEPLPQIESAWRAWVAKAYPKR